ncbi:C-type isolectin Sp-CL4-like [Dunckerocampus dactyliophorus]|uniref:C-type isolectin Sp-CL4-like n=1 Tax=Dunckerocampus dactyliophorus TaxID=161453 RepID=UPI0024075E29|nr:C-type isolectin Sp-CL4-like [Dunckerocampus dactyliophorus]
MELEECESDVCGVYRLNENSCVKVMTMERDFINAQQLCRTFQGKLVKVQNEEEHNKLLCMMYRLFPFRLHYWVSAVRGDDDVFYWFDGSGPVEFAPWREGQPDNFNKEICVWMNSGSWGAWCDGTCSTMNSVVCQIAM